METNVEEVRTRSKCKTKKTLSDFYPYRYECKKCFNQYRSILYKENPQKYIKRTNDYYKRHPEKIKTRNLRAAATRIGINANKIEKAFRSHNGICEICKRSETEGRRVGF